MTDSILNQVMSKDIKSNKFIIQFACDQYLDKRELFVHDEDNEIDLNSTKDNLVRNLLCRLLDFMALKNYSDGNKKAIFCDY